MGRAPCCEKIGLKKGPWTSEEDEKLVTFINQHGHGSWRALPKKAGLLRCGKSCRLRWTNYLRPDIKRGEFSPGEEQSIIQLHALLGNRWSAIASHLPKRTDNEIKNYWNTHLKKRLLKMGIDPATHKPKTETTSSLLESTSNGTAAVSHMAQWESARLEAEARLARESKMRASGLWPAAAATIFPILPSSPKLWNPLASSVLSEHYQCSPSRKGFNALELMNIVQNWEKSLQGQAGLMWPDSWKPSSVNMSDQQESSCCSSRHTDEMDHGSPTSTLCSLEANLQNVACTPGSSSAMDIRKLSWNDDCMFKEIVAAAMKGQPFSGLDNIRNPHLAKSCEVEDVLHSGDAGLTDSVDAENLSGLHSFQDLVMAAACDTHSPSPWSHASDAALSREVCNTADSGNIPALASATTSSSLLGELELATEDISSNKGAYSPVVCGEVSPEYQRSSGSARQNTSYSALLTEEFPDYWSNILKPLE